MSEHEQPPDVRTGAVEIDTGGERLPERHADAGELARPSRTRPPYAGRFGFMLGALGALALVALGAAALIVTQGGAGDRGDAAGSGWSSFRPSHSSIDQGAQEIAAHVAGEYKLRTGEQLVAVTGGPLEVQDLPITIAVRAPVADGGGIALLNGKGALYRLCGLGAKCSISVGKASVERHLLLRRQALELALYSFRYLDSIDDVVVFLPPAKGQDPSQAIHFRRGEVQPELTRPLSESLTAPTPTPETVERSPNASFVDRLTLRNLFRFSLTQGNQDASVFLVLEPMRR